MSIRAVLDANVLVSAAIHRGPSHRIVQGWMERERFVLLICQRLLDEVADVLQRPRLSRWISAAEAATYLKALRSLADVLDDPSEVAAHTRDPDDDYIIELARIYGADVIVSGDADLLQWPDQLPPVVTPAVFVAMLD